MNSDVRVTRDLSARALGETGLICVAIALLLHLLGLDSSFRVTLVISLCIGFGIHFWFLVANRVLAERVPRSVAAGAAVMLGLSVGLMLAGTLTAGEPLLFFRQHGDTLQVGLLFGVLGTAVVLSLDRLKTIRATLERAELTRIAQDRQLVETQLRVLQAQIEPHFLFNTLSNAISLIDRDPGAARTTLESLAMLLRATLTGTRSESVSLDQEFKLIEAYLAIQKQRLGARLDYRLSADPDLLRQPLPPLLVQPLVENALRHGIEPREAGGSIAVEARREGTGISIRVLDSGVGLDPFAPSGSAGSGTGLGNVRERLRVRYGAAAQLVIQPNVPHGLSVTMTIPGDLVMKPAGS